MCPRAVCLLLRLPCHTGIDNHTHTHTGANMTQPPTPLPACCRWRTHNTHPPPSAAVAPVPQERRTTQTAVHPHASEPPEKSAPADGQVSMGRHLEATHVWAGAASFKIEQQTPGACVPTSVLEQLQDSCQGIQKRVRAFRAGGNRVSCSPAPPPPINKSTSAPALFVRQAPCRRRPWMQHGKTSLRD